MNAFPSIPQTRHLQPQRLAERKQHLLAEIAAPSPRRPALISRWPRRTLVAAAASVLAATVGASALAYRLLGPSPGFTAGVSAFERLPRAEWPSSMPRVGLEHSAGWVGLSVAEAEARLRLLQTGLRLGPGRSEGEGSLYAFLGRNGTACLFLTGQGGSCVTPDAVDFVRSAMALVLPGYPGQAAAIVGLVADDVRAVEIVAGGRRWPVEIVNNSFYSDLEVTPEESVEIEVWYADDTMKRIRVRPGSGQRPRRVP